ncbi:MAG TPA: gamma-glutamylcyclotransferase family protein [Steroidobacteraceae bacterium]|jgi:hypothetical protein
MQDRRVAVFFYGLFMDAQALRARGLHPQAERPARVDGFALRIGKRATLVPDPAGCAYGILMDLTHAEVDKLHSDPSVSVYRPEAVLSRSEGTRDIAALCFNLPAPPDATERNAEYAGKLRELAHRLGLPAEYVGRIGE